MKTISNPDVVNNATSILFLQPITDGVINSIDPTAKAVIEIGPRFSTEIFGTNVITGTGASTLVTTDTKRDFYLTSAHISCSKDVLADMTSLDLRAIINGKTIRLLQLNFNTLTVDTDHLEMTYAHPIKIDRNTAIQISGTFTAGTVQKVGTITGFYL